MPSGGLIIDQSEKMTEILSDELNKSNQTLFSASLYSSYFLFPRCGHFVPIPHPHPKASVVGSATRERVKRCVTINHCANARTQQSTE